MISNRNVLGSVMLGAAILLVAGCGRNLNTTSYNVSGMIKLDGEPIPNGTIRFIPDTSKGNEGPTGFATITDGVYNTKGRHSQGIEGGAYIIVIDGFDGVETKSPGGDKLINGKKLFETYVVREDLAAENTTFDLDISSDDTTPPINE